jgi:tRNA wybutosine-synthesizing protein 2
MRFKEQLRENLERKLSEEKLSILPRGFQTIGKVMILKLHPNLLENKKVIGKACLELHSYIRSVYLNLGKIEGKFRKPEKMELIAGENNPMVSHKEHDVIYQFDITKLMFSKGNLNERKFLATLISDNEIIVDMFAGIGYFSLPIAKHARPKQIYSIELNSLSYDFLIKNIKLNHLEDKITPILGDCKEEVLKLSKKGIKADRVIMGVFPAPKDFISEALTLAKDDGTIYHYEGVIDKNEYLQLFNEFKNIAESFHFKCSLVSHRFVKSYGPNLYHVVLDIQVARNN